MEHKKIKLEELIRIAKENKDKIYNTNIADNLDDVAKFILTFNIKDGKNKVPSNIVYQAYCNWTSRPKSNHAFLLAFTKCFSKKKTTSKVIYLLNYKPMQLINEVERRKISYE
jgi:hypothetical protein